MEKKGEDTQTQQQDDLGLGKNTLAILSVGILVVFLLLIGGIYFWVSKKSKGEVVFPAGINYTGQESPNPTQPPQRPQYDYAALAAATDSVTFTSSNGQYKFAYPPGMIPLIFPGDPNDSATFDVAEVPAQFNIMALVERISNYDSKLVGRQREFVNNYWNFFGGLKGVQSIEDYTNEKGIKGWKVSYVNKSDVKTGDNYFFPIPGDNDRILHVSNVFPPEGEAVFAKILNSLELKK